MNARPAPIEPNHGEAALRRILQALATARNEAAAAELRAGARLYASRLIEAHHVRLATIKPMPLVEVTAAEREEEAARARRAERLHDRVAMVFFLVGLVFFLLSIASAWA